MAEKKEETKKKAQPFAKRRKTETTSTRSRKKDFGFFAMMIL